MDRIGDAVERELSRSGSGQGVPLGRLTCAWPDAVGPAVARNAWPARVSRDGTLQVNTSSATWAFELTQLAGEIEERLRAALGDDAPPRLRFTTGPVPEPGDPEEPRGPAGDRVDRVDVPPDVAATADAVASAIDDPDLRALVARAARASLSRPPSDRRF